jgi:hypothetical protein
MIIVLWATGYTLTENTTGKKSDDLHEYEFKDMEDLRRFFTPHFKFVRVCEPAALFVILNSDQTALSFQ